MIRNITIRPRVLMLSSLIVLPSILRPELVSLVLVPILFYAVLKANLKLDKALFKLFLPVIFMVFLGAFFVHQNILWNVFKDIWYLLKIIISIAVGWYLAKDLKNSDILLSIVISGSICSLIHIFSYWVYSLQNYDALHIRYMTITSSVTVVLSGMLISNLFLKRYFQMGPSLYAVLLVINLYSIWLGDSRSSILGLFIMLLALNGFYKVNAKSVAVGFLSIAILWLMISNLSVDEGLLPGERETLSSRFARGFDEIIPADHDRADANISFRGYESFKAIVDYAEGSVGEMVVGQGFGATVDLGESWVLGGVIGEESGEVEFDEVLIIHNGYLLVLVKYGFVGLCLYLFFVYSWIRSPLPNRSASIADKMLYRLLVSLSIMVIMYSLLVSGLFNKSAFNGLLIIAGALLSVCHLQESFKKIDSF